MEKHYNYLIVGGDATGLSAAGRIRAADKAGTIGVLEKGRIISYGACGLPYVLSGDVPDVGSLIHFTPEKFAARTHCDVITETAAEGADLKKRLVFASSPNGPLEISYDKLLIAVGARPNRLPFLDYDGRLVFELKTIPDAELIQAALARGAKRILIVGAGYIGLETAEALRRRGLEVVVVDSADRPVANMPEAISRGVAKTLKQQEITFLPSTVLESARPAGNGIALESSRGTLEADMILTAVGIRPATDFLNDTDLEMERGAVVVDRGGRASVPDVFAGGDCALVYHALLEKNVYLPLGSTANKQGRIAGINMAGGDISFPGILGTRIFKFFDQCHAVTGLSEEQAAEIGLATTTLSAMRNSRAGYYPGGDRLDVRLVVELETGRILGGNLTGPLESSALIDVIGVMAMSGTTAREAAWFDAAYAPPFAPVWNAVVGAAGKFNLL